jgi:hypothetical protein
MPDLALVGLGGAGLVAGLGLLARGFVAQRAAARIEDLATSRIGSLAAGEVRVTGEAQAAGVTLTSPVRGRPCLYYRATAKAYHDDDERTLFDEERGIGFFVKDTTGVVRVFPRGARWDVTLDEPTPWAEGPAGGLRGGTLLSAPGPDEDPLHPGRDDLDFAMPMLMASATRSGGSQSVTYREWRIEAGDVVTIVGRALPFRDLADPTEVDEAGDRLATLTGAVSPNHVPDPDALRDPEVAASYADALRDGTLAASPAEAWGNAAIEGFGIGRPVRQPELDPSLPGAAASSPSPTAATGAADPVGRSFELPPDALVLAEADDTQLVIAAGTPVQAATRQEDVFFQGLLGAVLAIAAAVFLALVLTGNVGLG